MRILAIETSCDETGIAILDASGSKTNAHFLVRSNIVASQIKIHAKFGGVVPNLAKREHQKNLVSTLLKALEISKIKYQRSNIKDQKSKSQNSPPEADQPSAGKFQIKGIFDHEPELLANFQKKIAKLPVPEIDAIAVTVGPGLAPALWTGVNFARALSLIWKKPIIPVNHLAGHIYINALHGEKIKFPALALIVSGGHTELVLIKGFGKYRIIGETRDDAAGEAFDKVARLLGLGYPGGPAISALAAKFSLQPSAFSFSLPRPMINSNDFDFSFSGLKTAVLYKIKEIGKINNQSKIALAKEFQDAVTSVLVSKTIRAAKKEKIKTLILGGGVAANAELRKKLTREAREKLPSALLLLPDIRETTDNALMIATAAFFDQKKAAWKTLHADPGLRLSKL